MIPRGERRSSVRSLISPHIKDRPVQIPHWSYFFLLALEQSASRFASLSARQQEPRQGSGSRGLFIELSGLHGHRRGMCQRENASFIKARSETCSYFCQMPSRVEGFGRKHGLYGKKCTVSCPAPLPTQSPLHLHRRLDLTEHLPITV